MSDLMDLGSKYTQQARSLHVQADGWIRGHHVPGAIAGARTKAGLFDVSPSKTNLRMYYEALLKLEREIQIYSHRMAQLSIRLTRYANEALEDLKSMGVDTPPLASDWSVIAPDEDEETWLERNRNLYR